MLELQGGVLNEDEEDEQKLLLLEMQMMEHHKLGEGGKSRKNGWMEN